MKKRETIDTIIDCLEPIIKKEILKNDLKECHFFPARNDLVHEISDQGKIILEKLNKLKRTLKQTQFILSKKESTKLWMKIKT